MPYTSVWDNLLPLDTQAANQGAADFRSLKADVNQRMAFISGNLASRPTPETTSATVDWSGFMYWAVDTKQVFQWDGTAWVDISADLPNPVPAIEKFYNVTPNTLTDTGGVPQVGMTLTLPANVLSVGSAFRINARVKISAAGSATPMSTLSLFLGGTNLVWYPLNILSPGIFSGDQYVNLYADGICNASNSIQGYGYAGLGIMTGPAGGQFYDKAFDINPTFSSGILCQVILGSEKTSGTTVIFQNLSVLVFN